MVVATDNLWNNQISTWIPAFFFFIYFWPWINPAGLFEPTQIPSSTYLVWKTCIWRCGGAFLHLCNQAFTHTFLPANKLISILQRYVLWQGSPLGARFKEQLHSSWRSYTCSSLCREQPRRFKQFQTYSFWWFAWLFSEQMRWSTHSIVRLTARWLIWKQFRGFIMIFALTFPQQKEIRKVKINKLNSMLFKGKTLSSHNLMATKLIFTFAKSC